MSNALDHILADNIVNLYFHQMTQTPLLTHAEEVLLAQQIALGKEAHHRLKDSDNLTPMQTAELIETANQAQKAREKLAGANTRLVVSIAKRYQNLGLPLADLIQEGNIGLMHAVDGFDHTRGIRFSSYAVWWIRQAIIRALTNKSRLIRLPLWMTERLRQISTAVEMLNQKLDRVPSTQEISAYLGMPPEVIDDVVRHNPQIVALESPAHNGEEYGDTIMDTRAHLPEETVSELLLAEAVATLLETLELREQQVLMRFYGVNNNRQQCLAEIGRSMGLSRERIRQIKEEALHHLRQSPCLELLKEYMSA